MEREIRVKHAKIQCLLTSLRRMKVLDWAEYKVMTYRLVINEEWEERDNV